MSVSNACPAIADTGHNAALYYSGRKGWHFVEISTADWRTSTTDSKQAISELARVRGEGAGYFAVCFVTALPVKSNSTPLTRRTPARVRVRLVERFCSSMYSNSSGRIGLPASALG